MTPAEFESAMRLLGLTQGMVAKKMGVRPETVNRWLRGVKGVLRDEVPGPAAAAMRGWMAERDRLVGPPVSGEERGMM
jgi:hypothetical protein